jgi:hypothetical protein
MSDMVSMADGEFLTYREAADRLNVSPQAIRQKAIRGRWLRVAGNDGKTRVQVPDTVSANVSAGQDETGKHHVRHRVREPDVSLMDALREHNATLKADVERLEAQLRVEADRLAAAEARAEKQATEFLEQNAQHAADLAAERARTEKAIEVFAVQASRLDRLAEERAKPWWRRFVALSRQSPP